MATTPIAGAASTERDRGRSRSSPAVGRGPVPAAASEAYRSQAGRYDERTGAFQHWRERLVARLPARPGDTVLDVGCGTGLCLPLLREKVGPGGTIVGIDASEQMLQVAADGLKRAADIGLHWTGRPGRTDKIEGAVAALR